MAFICFLPVVCFLLCFLYYLALIIPLASGHPAPGSIVGITSRNYDTLLLMLATAATITAPVFIYCLIIIARLKTMNAPTKLKCLIVPMGSGRQLLQSSLLSYSCLYCRKGNAGIQY